MIVGGTLKVPFRFTHVTAGAGTGGTESAVIFSPVTLIPDPGGRPVTPPGETTSGPTGLKMDINPYFGAAFFFLAGALRLHPATATAGLLLGGGAAVINYGAGSAMAQEPVDFGSEQPGWLTPHF